MSNSNFDLYFNQKYSEEKLYLDIQLNRHAYIMLRDFYEMYNFDSIAKTFTSRYYSKYEFKFNRLFTKNDLFKSLTSDDMIATNDKRDMLRNYYRQGLIKETDYHLLFNNHHSFFNQPISWRELMEVISNSKLIEEKDLRPLLQKVADSIENRKLNFKEYRETQRRAKKEIVYVGIMGKLKH